MMPEKASKADMELVLGKIGAEKVHDEEECPVCQHESVQLIEAMYVDVRPHTEILGLFGKDGEEELFDEADLDLHFLVKGLHHVRSMNTDGYMRAIKEKGMAALDSGDMKVKPELLMKAIQHTDEKEGRMPVRIKDGAQIGTINVIGLMPGTGGALPPPPIQIEAEIVEEREEDEDGTPE